MGNKFYVYTITSVESGEVMYIGKGSGFRWKHSLKRIETISNTQCEVFIENVDSNDLALQRETKLIRSLSPVHNKRVSWRKLKAGSILAKLSTTIPFEADLVSTTKTHAGFNYELVQVGDNLFKLLVTKSGEGFETAEFNLSTKRSGVLRITTSGNGVTEPSKASAVEHRLVYDYVVAALSSVHNSLNTLGYDFTVDVTQAEWSEVRFGFDYNVDDALSISRYFRGICGSRIAANENFISVATELNFEFADLQASPGLKLTKLTGTKSVFNVGIKPSCRESLRVELSVKPDTITRGNYKQFRKIFCTYCRVNRSLDRNISVLAGLITIDAAKLLDESIKQLGLHLIFAAVRQSVVKDKVISLASNSVQKEIAEKWISGELELKSIKDKQKRRVILSFYRKVENNLRFNPGIVSFATFAFIRHSLRSSMVTKAELVELAGLEDSGENDARIIEIRRVAGERAQLALTSMRQVKAIWGI